MVDANDVSLGQTWIVTLWIMVAGSGAFISFRILARAKRRMRLWWDDYLIVMAWVLIYFLLLYQPLIDQVLIFSTLQVCLGIACACLTAAVPHGLGRHAQFLDSNELSAVLLLGFISAALTITASVWSKVSFALSLLRISSSGCTEWIRRTIVGIIISLNTMLAIAVAMILMSCRPIEKTWRPEIEGTCLDDKFKVDLAMALAGSLLPLRFRTMRFWPIGLIKPVR